MPADSHTPWCSQGIDWRRTAIFGTFALCFTGIWQYALFAKVMPRLIPGAEAFAAKPLVAKLAVRVAPARFSGIFGAFLVGLLIHFRFP